MKGISEIIATILMLMITLGISGTAYLFISGAFTQQTQGITAEEAFCVQEPSGIDNSTIVVRNLGTVQIDTPAVTLTQQAPSSSVSPRWSSATIAPGSSATLYDQCEGSGGRTCVYRITPPAGRTVPAYVSCT